MDKVNEEQLGNSPPSPERMQVSLTIPTIFALILEASKLQKYSNSENKSTTWK